MATKTKILTEREINTLICKKLKKSSYFVLNELRIHPAELDIVLLDLDTLYLTNIEIKRNNWKKVFYQAVRGKLYCHYSIAILPESLKKNVPIELFSNEGIGIAFYKVNTKSIKLDFEVFPKLSDSINRTFKKVIYKEINALYGNKIYA